MKQKKHEVKDKIMSSVSHGGADSGSIYTPPPPSDIDWNTIDQRDPLVGCGGWPPPGNEYLSSREVADFNEDSYENNLWGSI